LPLLEDLLEVASQNDVSLLLYPHAGCWLERSSDAARLCRKMKRQRLGVVFSSFHWYALGGGADLPDVLDEVALYLRDVNICGSRRNAEAPMGATFERFGEGEMDSFDVLAELRRVGYQGYLGVQRYGVQGDPYVNFGRSLEALREIEARLDRRPRWASLRRSAPLRSRSYADQPRR
jgi:sugar phosphate isomerase/epimerase